uniref:RNA polymerase alpha subunit n=1 Tax=Timspurckia oligopyrenoides TaxID=708627 RepID=UPI001FCDEC81|nr:RNA polymerase alpha subunit [Timspurckia oligopyrenoides]UNJ17504.1 RNA polymerase alpha subunit [Timspurckia oligopyrenoides]
MTHFEIECLESEIVEPRNLYGKFQIDNLRKGQGLTVGNALRRTLLSDITGTSIVAVRIAGLNHEFSIIPGIREDVLYELLNLKEVVFRSYDDKPGLGRIKIQGPAIITAGLLELPATIELVDPRQYIATISSNTLFEMDFHIESGCGYRLMEKKSNKYPVDFLQVDAVFMPVNKVSFAVEEITKDNIATIDRLVLEIWTNGSLTPQEALSRGAEVLTNLFNPLRNINVKATEVPIKQDEKKINQVLIEELQLSVRAYNCLKRAKIHSIADLLNYSQEELLEIKNFGQKSAEEVIEALERRLGISLAKEKNIM